MANEITIKVQLASENDPCRSTEAVYRKETPNCKVSKLRRVSTTIVATLMNSISRHMLMGGNFCGAAPMDRTGTSLVAVSHTKEGTGFIP